MTVESPSQALTEPPINPSSGRSKNDKLFVVTVVAHILLLFLPTDESSLSWGPLSISIPLFISVMYLLNRYPPREDLFLFGMQMHFVCLSITISKAFVLPVLHIIAVEESPAKAEPSLGIMATTIIILIVLHLLNPTFNSVVRHSDECRDHQFNFGALLSSVLLAWIMSIAEGFSLLLLGILRFFKEVFNGDDAAGVRRLRNAEVELKYQV
ncbi:hypothetical protein VNI00_002443 [Paramarasmius palmivorus]|uniref:Transmembrane protein n=1 Tax=Paramarasmius palmivorus TaxID=297713 RepID=A0AAW0DVR3_9AGAR